MSLRRAWVPTTFGRVLIAGTDRGPCFAALNEDTAERQLAGWISRWESGAEAREGGLDDAVRQLIEYGEGRRRGFELQLDLRGSPFELSVWRELVAIPFGKTRTYGELAQRVGSPEAARAVGRAAGANPIPVIVPCHRLVARGGLGGFTGGLHHKRRLLRLEGVPVAEQSQFV